VTGSLWKGSVYHYTYSINICIICGGVGFNFDGQKVAWFFWGRGCLFSN
jgi:hypothetical protein